MTVEEDEIVANVSGNIALDIGANNGHFTKLLARNFKRVYAIEPGEIFVALTERVMNQHENVVFVNKAIGPIDGKVKYFPSHSNPGQNTIHEEAAKTGKWGHKDDFVWVDSVTLDTFCEPLGKIDFIKCDIEGSEDFIFQYGKKALQRDYPMIAIEVHTHEIVNLKKLYELFIEYGYNSFRLDWNATKNETSFCSDCHYLIEKK